MGQVARDLVRIGRKSGPVGTYALIGTYGPEGTFCLIGAFSVISTYTPNFRKLLFRLLYCRVFTMLLPLHCCLLPSHVVASQNIFLFGDIFPPETLSLQSQLDL